MSLAHRWIIASLLGASPAFAQDTASAPTIVIRAEVTAREVRFAKQPVVRVRLEGGVLDSVRVIERKNLPDPVQIGQTYRDVKIAVEILGHLDAACLSARITRSDLSACSPRDTTRRSQPRDTTRRSPP